MPVFQKGKTKINYIKKGKGKPILFLHGVFVFSINWQHQIDYFSEKYQVIAPDLRGVGDSFKPRGFYNYTASKIAMDIVQLIESLGLEKIILVGHDYGGLIANWITLNRGDLVEKLILIAFPYPASYFPGALKSWKQLKMSSYFVWVQFPFLVEWIIVKNRTAFYKAIPNTTMEEVAIYTEKYAKISAVAKTINYYRAAIWYLFPFLWKRPIIEQPMLIIYGEKDTIMDDKLFEDSQKYCSKLTLLPLEEVEHWPHKQKPALVNSLIENFLLKRFEN